MILMTGNTERGSRLTMHFKTQMRVFSTSWLLATQFGVMSSMCLIVKIVVQTLCPQAWCSWRRCGSQVLDQAGTFDGLQGRHCFRGWLVVSIYMYIPFTVSLISARRYSLNKFALSFLPIIPIVSVIHISPIIYRGHSFHPSSHFLFKDCT